MLGLILYLEPPRTTTMLGLILYYALFNFILGAFKDHYNYAWFNFILGASKDHYNYAWFNFILGASKDHYNYAWFNFILGVQGPLQLCFV